MLPLPFFKVVRIIFITLATAIYLPSLLYYKYMGNEKKMQILIKKVGSRWGRKMIQIFNVSVEVEGSDNIGEKTYLIVSNHQFDMDIPLLLGYLPLRISFIAKKELEKIPFLSHWMKLADNIFLDRQNKRDAVLMLRKGVEVLKKGVNLVIFPEGTRSSKLLPFKKGSFRLAKDANTPILPIAIYGTDKLLEGIDKIKIKVFEEINLNNCNEYEKENLHLIVRKKIEEYLNSQSG